MVLPVVDAALIVVDGVAGVEVVTQRVWNYCEEIRRREHCGAAWIVSEQMRKSAGLASPTRLEELLFLWSCRSEKRRNLSGVVDLVRMKAL